MKTSHIFTSVIATAGLLLASSSVFAKGEQYKNAAGEGSLEMQIQVKAAAPTLSEAYGLASEYLALAKDNMARTGQPAPTGKFLTSNRRFVVLNEAGEGTIGSWAEVKKDAQNPGVTQGTLIHLYMNSNDAKTAWNSTGFICETNADNRLFETNKAQKGSASVLLPECRYNPSLNMSELKKFE